MDKRELWSAQFVVGTPPRTLLAGQARVFGKPRFFVWKISHKIARNLLHNIDN
jgi:hypothetical protein